MRIFSKHIGLVVASVVSAMAVASQASVVVSNYYGLYGDHTVTGLAGAVPAGNFNEGNGFPGNDSDSQTDKLVTQTGLQDADGNTTAVGATLSYDARFQSNVTISGSSSNSNLLFGAYFTRRDNDTPTPLTGTVLTLSGLNASDSYDLYVYTPSPSYGSGQSATISVGATSFNITSDNALTTLTQITAANSDGNYVVFSGLTGASSQVVNESIGFVGISGFQLVDNGPVQTPEPATFGMLGLGVAAMAKRRRRRIL